MATKKPIQVTLKETNAKNPWTYVVDYGGNKIPQPGKKRYVSAWSAKRGCCRAEGFGESLLPMKGWHQLSTGRQVVFTTKRRK